MAEARKRMSVMILRSTKGRKRNRLQLGLGTEPSLKLTELELIKRTEKKKKRRRESATVASHPFAF